MAVVVSRLVGEGQKGLAGSAVQCEEKEEQVAREGRVFKGLPRR